MRFLKTLFFKENKIIKYKNDMKKIVFGMLVLIASFVNAQSVNVSYINPTLGEASRYKYIRFGTEQDYRAGVMLNNSSLTYGDGDDFSIFTYGSRDITLRPGSGNVIFFPDATLGIVGIGTTDPKEKLQISEGNIGVFGYNTSRYIRFTEAKLQGAFINYDGAKNVLNIGVNNNNSDDVANDYNAISIVRANGNVGIGTATQTQKFEIHNSTSFNTNMYAQGQDHISFTANDPGNGGFFGGITWKSGERRRASIVATREHSDADHVGLAFFTKGTDGPGPIYESMRITRNGRVGIGTSNPDAELAVNGKIHTKEVKVDLIGWPDYVFEENYQLPTLQEVANHIHQKGHLINIPSAEEVSENGIELGQMNA